MGTPIGGYVKHMVEEAESALDYAEKSIIFAGSRPEVAHMYEEMAKDEMKHAGYLRKIGEVMLSENETSKQSFRCWTRGIANVAKIEATVKTLMDKG